MLFRSVQLSSFEDALIELLTDVTESLVTVIATDSACSLRSVLPGVLHYDHPAPRYPVPDIPAVLQVLPGLTTPYRKTSTIHYRL